MALARFGIYLEKSMSQKLIEWALDSLSKLKPEEDLLRRLYSSCEGEQFSLLIRYLYQSPLSFDLNSALREFFKMASSSRYTEKEWVQALVRFVEHNVKNNVNSNLGIMTGYMSCAAVSPEAKGEQIQFPALVEYCLETYGFQNRQ